MVMCASTETTSGAGAGVKPLRASDIRIGARASFSKTITPADLAFYGGISGDFNPLHVNEEYARTTTVGGRLVYELAVAALLSTVLGRVSGPGFRCQRHTLEFPRPVRIGDTVVATAEVTATDPDRGTVRCRTECRNQRDEIVVEGWADLASVLAKG
jgi:3-hydroxybutyryl-CoA dehydratase